MNQIGVREQNNYFKMESLNETEAGSPTTKLTVEKFPQGAEKEEQPLKQHKNVCRSHDVEVRPAVQRLVFISIITAAVAFLASVVCLILTLMVMTSTNNSTPSKDVDETQGQNCREIHNVSVKNLLRRIEDLENNALATEAKMKVLQAQVNETANKVAIVDGVWVNMKNISNRAASLEKGYTRMNNLMKTLQAINGSQNASHQDLQSTYNRLRDSLNAVNTTLFDKVAIVDDMWVNMKNISNRAASLEKGYTQMNNLIKTLQAINSSQNASYQDLQSTYNRLSDSLTAVNATLFDKLKSFGSNTGKPAANFSMCKHRTIAGTPTTAGSTYGTSDVFYSEPKGQRAMGITCSTDFARHYKLSELTQGPYQFKCTCKHLSPVFDSGSQSKRMTCYLHVWECPI